MYLALIIIAAALLTSLLRALTPFVAQYQVDIENYLSKVLGQKVVIGSMETGWYWFLPVIKLTDLTIFNDKQPVLDAQQLLVGLNLFSSLWHWQLEPGVLYVDKVHLTAHQRDDHWNVDGFSGFTAKNSLLTTHNNMQILSWLLAQQKLILKNISADLFLQDGTAVPIKQFDLVITRNFGRYKLKGDINVGRTQPTFLRVLADLSFDPKDLHNTAGEIYIYGRDVQPAFLHKFVSEHRWQVVDGLVNGKAWLSLAHGRLMSVQLQADVQNLDLLLQQYSQQPQHWRLDKIAGNYAWQQENVGWQLSADKLDLVLNGKQWPLNEFKINYDPKVQSWQIYVRHILLDSLLAQNISWPQAMQPLLNAHVHGDLQETQIHLKNNKLDYAISHFAVVSWHAFANYPSVDNLSGVVSWQPSQGRLSLDGQNTSIKLKNKPAIILQDLNAALNWQKLNYGWQFTLESLILRNKDLLASFTGTIKIADLIKSDSAVVKSGVSVILPWKQDAIMVSQLVAIPIHSLASEQSMVDFEPTINLKGALSTTNTEVWLQYLPKQYLKPKLYTWLTSDIHHIDRLVAELNVAGNLHDFPFDKVSASKTPGVFEINAHVSGMDLIFAPRWPLTRDIEADLHFDKRILTADVVYSKLQDIRVDEINLSVNDLGLGSETLLVHGKVRTTGDKALTYVRASPLVQKLPLLKILNIKGMLDLDLQLEAPLYPQNDKILTKGTLDFHDNSLLINHHLSKVALAKLTGKLPFDQDGILESNLTASIMGAPMTIKVQSTHTAKPVTLVQVKGSLPIEQLQAQMSSPLLNVLQGNLVIDSMLRINTNPGDLEHAELKSSLDGLTIQLPPPLGKLADVKTPFTVDFDFNPDSSMRLQINYADLLIDAIKAINGEWTIALNEANIAGKISYQPTNNQLTGQLSKLYLPQEKADIDEKNRSKSAIRVNDLPNITLQIQDFRYGSWNLGDVDCKATKKSTSFIIDSCKIKSPFYLIQGQGEWLQNETVNKTSVDMTMAITNLGKTLVQWGMLPAVDARKGEVEFSGAWPGGFYDFDLASIIGQASLVFKDGEITHLDAATEEKLGLGKLLSILSLQTLPRRLKLDFSDLVHKGYAFDIFRGHFAIARGIMQTTDSVIDGPTASASINGNLDIVKQLYFLKIKIAPHLTSSLPVVATIAGGPIIGAATWVASKIINQGMRKFSAYGYQITGPWKQPVVKQIDVFNWILDKTT